MHFVFLLNTAEVSFWVCSFQVGPEDPQNYSSSTDKGSFSQEKMDGGKWVHVLPRLHPQNSRSCPALDLTTLLPSLAGGEGGGGGAGNPRYRSLPVCVEGVLALTFPTACGGKHKEP